MEKDKLIKSFENCLSSGGCDNCPSGKEHRVFIDRDFVLTCRSLTKETLNILKNSVEVVRCKDCRYWQDNYGGYPHEECRWGKEETPDEDDFCSYGERKES